MTSTPPKIRIHPEAARNLEVLEKINKEVNALSIVILLGENETVSVPNSTLYETEVKIREA